MWLCVGIGGDEVKGDIQVKGKGGSRREREVKYSFFDFLSLEGVGLLGIVSVTYST